MHGRKRLQQNVALTEEERSAKLKKIARFQELSRRVLEMRHACDYGEDALRLCDKVLEVNPEFSTLWNYRREILMARWASENKVGDLSEGESQSRLLVDPKYDSQYELDLVERSLMKNPKLYCAWFHRVWVAEHGRIDLARELALCTKYLSLDNRNFHCWDYRRVIARMLNVDDEAELAYTRELIGNSFSNYSAWHYRSKLLERRFEEMEHAERERALELEFKLVENAVFTEPDDQSSWLYHRWLLDHSSDNAALVRRELSMCEELLEIEPNCKWALLTSSVLIYKLKSFKHLSPGDEFSVRIDDIFRKLNELDPFRSGYYSYARTSFSAPS